MNIIAMKCAFEGSLQNCLYYYEFKSIDDSNVTVYLDRMWRTGFSVEIHFDKAGLDVEKFRLSAEYDSPMPDLINESSIITNDQLKHLVKYDHEILAKFKDKLEQDYAIYVLSERESNFL